MTKDRLDQSGAEAVRRCIFLSSIHNGGNARTSITRGYWMSGVVDRNIREAVEACELSDGLRDCVDLLRELGELDSRPIKPCQTRRLHGNRQSQIRAELAKIIADRFGVYQQLLGEREAV